MKFSRKLILGLTLSLLSLAFAGAFAQSNTMNSVTSPTTSTLNSVFIVNNSTTTTNDLTKADAWAVGDGGIICKWNGATWATVTSPTTTNLYGVFFNSNTMGWAVGGNATNGIILRYTNGNWSVWNVTSTSSGSNATQQNILNATFYSITTDGTGNVGWAVGASGSTFGFVGQDCFTVPSGTNVALRSVGMVHNSTDAWAVGDDGTILAYSNSTGTGTWTKMTSPTNVSLYGLQMINANTAWAVGGSGNNGAIITLNGSTWSNFTKVSFGGMGATSANDKINATLYSISANNATSAWAVGGNGTVLYWGGTQWDGQTGVTTADLKGVSLMHGNFTTFAQAWAVGTGGKIIAWAGNTWVPEIPMIALPALLVVGVSVAVLGKTRLFRKPLF